MGARKLGAGGGLRRSRASVVVVARAQFLDTRQQFLKEARPMLQRDAQKLTIIFWLDVEQFEHCVDARVAVGVAQSRRCFGTPRNRPRGR